MFVHKQNQGELLTEWLIHWDKMMLSVLDIFKFLEISQKKILLKPMSSMFDKVDAVVRTATLIITSPNSPHSLLK